MSDIKSILVHADSSPGCTMRLHMAHRLAEQYDAAVTAAYAVTPSIIEYPGGFNAGPDVATLMLEFDGARRDRARGLFDQAVASGMPRLKWVELADEPARAFGHEALYADLLVLGQCDPNDAVHDVPTDFVELVLVDSGTPALVVPYIGVPPTVGRTALVAWKETRESARAVTAALPLLQAADQVHVALWSDRTADADDEAQRLTLRLRRHAVTATVHRCGSESRELGEHLLSLAGDVGADLLVMGCYGHSRAREWVMGGTTRTVLRSMTLPVLLAH